MVPGVQAASPGWPILRTARRLSAPTRVTARRMVPSSPTTTHEANKDPSANSLATISGPMPAGSPIVMPTGAGLMSTTFPRSQAGRSRAGRHRA